MATTKQKTISVNIPKERWGMAKDGRLKELFVPGTEERTEELNPFNRVENPDCIISVQCGGSKVQYSPTMISGRIKISGKMIDGELHRDYFIVELGDMVATD